MSPRVVAATFALAGVAAFSSLAVTAAPAPPGGARSPAAHVEGPPPGHTGGFRGPTCLACHTEFDLNPEGGRLTLLGWPERYEPGRTYDLTVRLDSEEMGAAGFQLAVRFASGRTAGTFAAQGLGVAVRDSAGVAYAQHTRLGSVVESPEHASWAVRWTAPDTGAVQANLAANSANGDNSPFGDFIYAAEVRAEPASPSGSP